MAFAVHVELLSRCVDAGVAPLASLPALDFRIGMLKLLERENLPGQCFHLEALQFALPIEAETAVAAAAAAEM